MSGVDFAALKALKLSAVIGQSIKLRRAGREWTGLCPFHGERTPSFTVNDDKGFAHCFGCGWHGDVADFVAGLAGCGLREAVERLGAGDLPVATVPTAPAEPERDTTAEAILIWRSAGPIAGTPAEAYLRGRGLDLRLPESLRFARLRYGKQIRPCLIALVANAQDKIGGIQRTFVREDGSGKADVPAPKLSLGRIGGGAIRLAPAAGMLVVTGGLEDGLTLQQELGQAVWAATGEGNMATLVLPLGVQSVVIGADRDDSGEAHAKRAADAFALQGRSVRIIRPMPGHKDFNSELQGIAA